MSKRYPGGIIRKTPQTPSQTSAQGVWDMASVTQAVKENTWPIAGVPDPISKSLRFRSSASAYLDRTPSSAGNQKIWTISFWTKINPNGNNTAIIANNTSMRFGSTADANTITTNLRGAGGTNYFQISNAVYRDPSAWYHVVWAVDTTQATDSNRSKIYVNGVQVTSFSTANYPPQNQDTSINASGVLHYIGRTSTVYYYDGYLAEYNLIDGQALTPSSFGGTNDQTGVWQPIAYTGTYGTNGFYLPFSNTASTTTLGYDFSGNNNNWTPNNISLTSGSTYDSMVDVPTQWIPYNTAGDTGALFRGNYCVLNPLDIPTSGSPATLSNGNLNAVTPSSGYGFTVGTIAVSSGKWYWEYVATAGGNMSLGFGLTTCARTYAGDTGSYMYYIDGKTYANNGAGVTYGATWTTNDVIAVALDLDAGTAVFYKNGVSQGTAFTGLSGTFFAVFSDQSPSLTNTFNVNFGQRPFSYTPPAGFKTLCTTNLSTPTIGATASTTANKYFDISLYTGNGSTQSITNSGSMQPDFVWLKMRSGAVSHGLFDSIRGVNKLLYSDLTNAESPFGSLSAFNSNGFSLTTGSEGNTNGSTYVGWQWRASNAAGVTNTAGSITSTVSANTTAGFSVVTYTGSGAAATVGHGLGVAPSMIIIKDRDNGTYDWNVYHASLSSPTTLKLYLNTTDAENNGGTNSGTWNSTAPTSTVFSLGTFLNVNKSGDRFVAYCFAQIAGYSAFGKYTGNGSSDGPFVFTGFRPKYVMIKRSDSTASWYVQDSVRDTYNQTTNTLYPNLSAAEDQGYLNLDLLSNGFKIRTTTSNNASGGTYVYVCFAESPFKFALAR